MSLAPAKVLRAHIRKMTDKKFRALHKTVNDPALLHEIGAGERKTVAEVNSVKVLVNAEFARRFER